MGKGKIISNVGMEGFRISVLKQGKHVDGVNSLTGDPLTYNKIGLVSNSTATEVEIWLITFIE